MSSFMEKGGNFAEEYLQYAGANPENIDPAKRMVARYATTQDEENQLLDMLGLAS